MSNEIKDHPKLGAFLEQMEETNPGALKAMELIVAAIVGYIERIGTEPLIVYNREKCLEIIMRDDECEYEEALEHFEFNVIGGWHGEGTPVFMTTLDECVSI